MNKILEAQNVFTSKVSLQLQHVEHRFKRRIEQLPFRLDSNRKHYERIARYKDYLYNIRYFLEQDQHDEVLATIKEFWEVLDSRIDDIKLADSSEAGWELVERMHSLEGTGGRN